MKKALKFLLCMTLAVSVLFSCAIMSVAETELNNLQRNAIAMLNYISVITQDISASDHGKLELEEIYTSLINDINPNAVDGETLQMLEELLDTLEGYRVIKVKRDRIQYQYEQQKAEAILAIVPTPFDIMNIVQAEKPATLKVGIGGAALNSLSSYLGAVAETKNNVVTQGWELDDEQAEYLHNSRKNYFSYMVKIVNQYELPENLTLTEKTVEEFVRWKRDDNVLGRIRYLESNRDTYAFYGGYWLTLAESYYENGDYEKCIEAVDAYLKLGSRIFRKDYELAKVLPLAIISASEVFDEEQYVSYADEKCKLILTNTDNDEWSLRYFVAQVEVELFAWTNDKTYLEAAYEIVFDNVNTLVKEQRAQNATYLADVVEAETPKDATKSEKKEIERYNDMMEELRETELAPVCEPLLLNCDLLFALADELDKPQSELEKINGILHINGEMLILNEQMDSKYRIIEDVDLADSADIEMEYGGTIVILPVLCLSKDTRITVTVSGAGSDPITATDWKIDEVKRETQGIISSFVAAYVSENIKQVDWLPDMTVSIDVFEDDKSETALYHFEYKTLETKTEWYDWLKVWEGQRNNWYDYFKVWENSVDFERVV